jgi:hypothetical protein
VARSSIGNPPLCVELLRLSILRNYATACGEGKAERRWLRQKRLASKMIAIIFAQRRRKRLWQRRHCEEQSDEAIQLSCRG